MLLVRFLSFLLISATLCLAQSFEANPERSTHGEDHHRLWVTSCIALVAASGLDAASSWNKSEMNPLLQSAGGRFGAKGVSIKFLITGAMIAPQFYFRHNRTAQKWFAFSNFAEAGVVSGIAVRNFRISADPARPN
jgi:hypothetical protein